MFKRKETPPASDAALEAGSPVAPPPPPSEAASTAWATGRQVSVVVLFLGQLAASNLNVVTGTGSGIGAAFERGGPLCTCLQPAGAFFSIWAVIYTALATYAVWQALPGNQQAPLARKTGWLACIAFLFLAAWGGLASAAPDAGAVGVQAALVVILALALRACWMVLAKLTSHEQVFSHTEAWCVAFPWSILTAWLLVATLLNVGSLLLVTGVSTLAAEAAGFSVCVSGVTLLWLGGIALWAFTKANPYVAAVIVWALVGVAVANAATAPDVFRAAIADAVLLAAAAVLVWRFFHGPRTRWQGTTTEDELKKPLLGEGRGGYGSAK